MSKREEWEISNERYLAAWLEWLRLLLAGQAEEFSGEPRVTLSGDIHAGVKTPPPVVGLEADAVLGSASPGPDAIGRRKRASAGRKQEEPAAPSTRQSAAATNRPATADLTRAAEAVAAAAAATTQPAAITLAQRLGLTAFELNILMMCAAMELDTRIPAYYARAHDDPSRPYPTFALAFALFGESHWDALSPERPLRYWRLIEIHQPGAQPLTLSQLRCDERILSYLKGLTYVDDRLSALLTAVDTPETKEEVSPSQQDAVDAILRQVRSPGDSASIPVVQLLGTDSPSKQLVAAHAAAALCLSLFRLSFDLVPQSAELETVVRLWNRETILLRVALYLDGRDSSSPETSGIPHPPLLRLLARSKGLVFLDTRDLQHRLERLSVAVDVAKPTATEQHEVWKTSLGPSGDAIASRLTGQFNMSRSEILRISRAVSAAADAATSVEDRLWDSCVQNTRPQLDALAQRITPKARWEDIVLPQQDENVLREISSQVSHRRRVYGDWGFHARMNRGLGITALFLGESGTGKTMAAEVIAHELRLNLYRIDLSAVVSKYIGETEKNLRRLFDAAEDGGALLFFDEADALFGKRSEVRDSHDRYANIEINYLLQRMESYRGLAILATNMKSALDVAFMRRLRFIVQFLFPAAAERKKMWQRVFPPQVPTEGLDFDRLSRLNLTGGSIQNVAINAAFAAAGAESMVTMPLVLIGARAEFRKLEQPVNEADFQFQPIARRPA